MVENLVEDAEPAALYGVAGGKGHHQAVRHVEDGVAEGIEQVVGEDDPNELKRQIIFRDQKQQDPRDGEQGGAEHNPGSGLPLGGMGAVDDDAHQYVCDRVDDFGNNREKEQEHASPNPIELQNVGVIDVEVGREDRVEEQRSRGAEQISDPFLGRGDVFALHPRGEDSPRKSRLTFCFFHDSFPPESFVSTLEWDGC